MSTPRPSGTEPVGTGTAAPERPADEPTTPPTPPAPQPSISPTSALNGGLFRKRPNAIGPAPVYFEVALGLLFGISFGLIFGHPIITAVVGALLGLLYALFRRSQPPR